MAPKGVKKPSSRGRDSPGVAAAISATLGAVDGAGLASPIPTRLYYAMPVPESQGQMTPGADELQRRRRAIRRDLHRSHYAVVAASGVIGLFALAALWLGAQARQRAEEAHAAQGQAETKAAEARAASGRLWEFSTSAARQERLSRTLGQRREALEIIREAARFRPARELRDEALSALLLPDLGTNVVWHSEAGYEVAGAYDANLEYFVLNNNRGRAIVRRAADGATLMDEAGFGPATMFWQFSGDGRLAALAFQHGPVAVWDWQRTNLLARFPTPYAEWAEPPFDFARDGRHLWLLTTNQSLACRDLESSQITQEIPLEHPPRFVRLSPSGKLAAVACGNRIEVWDLSACARQSTLTLTNDIWRLAWQPGDERLALGGPGGLRLWTIGTSAADLLRPEGTVTVLFFAADGDLLWAGGYEFPGEAWSVRSRRVVLQTLRLSPWQLSADQTQMGVAHGRVGYGVQACLPPVGKREWPAPPSLGEQHQGGSLDAQERWVLTGHPHGWLLRDAESGRELLRVRRELSGLAGFDHLGSNVVAWTTDGLARWALQVGDDGSLTVLPEQLFASSAPPIWSASCFSADRRFTAYPVAGRAMVVSIDHPAQRVEIPLQVPADSSLYLSPDGHWLVTGLWNDKRLDLYDTRTGGGRFVRRFAEDDMAGPRFDSHTGRLFTSTSTAHCEWDLETGALKRKVLWRTPEFFQGFADFAPGGRVALVKSSPSAFQLYDLEAGRDFATLDFRDPQTAYACHWSRDGQRLFLFANDGGVTRLDLAALRAELDRLGLDWPDDDPSREYPALEAKAGVAAATPSAASAGSPSATWGNPPRLAWWVAFGLLVTVAIGHSILRYQRRLFTGYLETDALAEQRANELRETHAALAHSEKMKALGTMAAGVAHDVNNLLSVIRLSSDLIEERTTPDPTTRENFGAIQHAVQRGRGLVNSMLGYARDDGQVRSFAPGSLVSDAVALLSRPFLRGLVLVVDVAPDLPAVMGRRGRIEQMLLNLVVNAAEAMNGRGTLRLSARRTGEATGCMLPPWAVPEYVELTVADDGPGIAPEVLPRIFEPFFTTKHKGAQRGTGLGLSMLYTMAREDGIGIGVTCTPGQGAVFRLLLPAEPRLGATCPLPAAPLAPNRPS